MSWVFAHVPEDGVQSQADSYQRLDAALLNTQHYKDQGQSGAIHEFE